MFQLQDKQLHFEVLSLDVNSSKISRINKHLIINFSSCSSKFKKKRAGKAQHIKGTRYDGGDWRVAVMWYLRAGDDDERLTFREPPSNAGVDFSTALSSAS